MALVGKLNKLNKNNIFRFDFDDAYFIVNDEILIDSRKEGHAIVVLVGYANEYARHNYGSTIYKNALFVPHENFSGIGVFNKNTVKEKIYNYIKKQPEFKLLKDHLSDYSGPYDFEKNI